MNNTLMDFDLTRLLPEPLKNDITMLALGRAVSDELKRSAELARLAVIYPCVEQLNEPLLDILAVDFKVYWYDFNGTLSE